ncbi:hypothetical protein ACH4F6_14535 [Streptomyces sp. NPDC017936]|uniref:hypothetical protein n=1 Tax=Streptomyces sp. NPDC017936 TaxID=3365016 RepID=UPI0037997416
MDGTRFQVLAARTRRPTAHVHPGQLSTSHLATHSVPLEEAPRAYEMFKTKEDGCVRAVLRPGG